MARKRSFYNPRPPFVAARDMTGQEIADVQGDKSATELQFFLYHDLFKAGFEVWPELRLPSRHHPSGYFRADLALLRPDNTVAALIECKPEGKYDCPDYQRRAYEDTGIPWTLATLDEAFPTLHWCEQFKEATKRG